VLQNLSDSTCRVEEPILTGRERRRRWSTEQKLEILRESWATGTRVAKVALGDADHLGRMQAVRLVLVFRLLRQEPLNQTQEAGEPGFFGFIPGDLAANISVHPPQIGAKAFQFRVSNSVMATLYHSTHFQNVSLVSLHPVPRAWHGVPSGLNGCWNHQKEK
jgi:hypothetical protein